MLAAAVWAKPTRIITFKCMKINITHVWLKKHKQNTFMTKNHSGVENHWYEPSRRVDDATVSVMQRTCLDAPTRYMCGHDVPGC